MLWQGKIEYFPMQCDKVCVAVTEIMTVCSFFSFYMEIKTFTLIRFLNSVFTSLQNYTSLSALICWTDFCLNLMLYFLLNYERGDHQIQRA